MARKKRGKGKSEQAANPSQDAEGVDSSSAAPPAKPLSKKAARAARRAAARADDDSVKPSQRAPANPGRHAARVAPRTGEELELWDDIPALIVGLLCAWLPAVVQPGLRDLYQLPKTFALTVGAAWLVAGVAALALLGRRLRFPKTPLLWPLVGLAASIAVAVALAPAETGGVLSIFAKMDAYRWSAAMIVGVGTLATVRTPRQLLYVVGGMLIGGFQVAIYGIAQHHGIDGLLPAEARRWVGINKPGSTFGNRNMAAQLIVSVMPAGYVLLAMAMRWWRRGRVSLAIAVGASANLLLFVLLYYLRLSVTRSAWGGAMLGVVVAVGVFGLGRLLGKREAAKAEALATPDADAPQGKRRSVLPMAAGLLVTGVLAITLASGALVDKGFKARLDKGVGDEKRRMSIPELVATVGDFDKPHWSMRFMMWASTWEAIKARPFGGGAGNWRVLFPQHVTQREDNDHFSISKQPTRAHNDFLQMWSEFGAQGFLSFMALLVVLAWMAVRTVALQTEARMREREDVAWMSLAAVTSIAGIVAICGDALLSFPFQLPAPTFAFFVHLGVIGAAWVYAREQRWRLDNAAHVAAGGEPLPRPFSEPTLPKDAVKWGLVATAVLCVGFVYRENPRLLRAETGFTDARAMQKRGRPSAALLEIKKAIEINPDDFQNHFIEALCHNSLRDAPKSVEAIQRSLKLYPNLLNAWVNLAMFARKAGQTQVMEDALTMALTLKPDEAYALNVKARHLMKQRKNKEAAALLKPFIDRHKHNNSYLANAQRAFTLLGDWATVARINTWQVGNIKARRLRPGQPNYKRLRAADARRVKQGRLEGWAKVGDAWVKAGMWAKAVPAFAEAAALAGFGRSDLKRKYAVSLAYARKFKASKHEVGVTLDVAKSEADALLTGLEGARAAMKTDADRAAIDGIMRAVEKRAGDAVKHRKARQALDDDKKIAEFIAKYTKLKAAGKFPEALTWLEKAAGRGKERRGDVKRAYAVALAQNGQWGKALHEAKVAVRIDWQQRERLVIGLKELRKLVDKNAAKQLDDLIAKVRLL